MDAIEPGFGRAFSFVLSIYGCTSNVPTSHIAPPGRGSPRWSAVSGWSLQLKHPASRVASMATLPGS